MKSMITLEADRHDIYTDWELLSKKVDSIKHIVQNADSSGTVHAEVDEIQEVRNLAATIAENVLDLWERTEKHIADSKKDAVPW